MKFSFFSVYIEEQRGSIFFLDLLCVCGEIIEGVGVFPYADNKQQSRSCGIIRAHDTPNRKRAFIPFVKGTYIMFVSLAAGLRASKGGMSFH